MAILPAMSSGTFYPDGQGAPIDRNTNILNNSTLLGTLGFTAAQITGITNDCTLTVYLLSSVGEMADSTYASLHGFARSMEKSAPGAAAVPWPAARSYVDHTPLAAPGVPESRQYQLLAMQHDVVIGLPSPILTVVVS